MSLRNPLARAKGLVSPWFVILMVGLIGDDQHTVRAVLAQPLTAALMTAFVLSLLWHARLGLQVVIEDYVHGGAELLLQVIVKFVFAIAAIASLLAIGRIVFTA